MLGWIEVFHADQVNSRIYRATHPLTLQRAHRIVGGYVEAVPHWDKHMHNDGEQYDAVALCNEDGKGLGLLINRTATARWATAMGMSLRDLIQRDVLCGTVVLAFGDREFMKGWVPGDDDAE